MNLDAADLAMLEVVAMHAGPQWHPKKEVLALITEVRHLREEVKRLKTRIRVDECLNDRARDE